MIPTQALIGLKERVPMSQSLIHQVNDSYINNFQHEPVPIDGRNPLFIRSMIPTEGNGLIGIGVFYSRNPLFIRSMIPTNKEKSLLTQRQQECRNPLFIRSMIPT